MQSKLSRHKYSLVWLHSIVIEFLGTIHIVLADCGSIRLDLKRGWFIDAKPTISPLLSLDHSSSR